MSFGGGSAGFDQPSFGNIDLSGALGSTNAATANRYNQLGLGGGTAEQTDLSNMGQLFGIEQQNLANQLMQDQFKLSAQAQNQPSGLAQLAGLLGF